MVAIPDYERSPLSVIQELTYYAKYKYKCFVSEEESEYTELADIYLELLNQLLHCLLVLGAL